MCSRYDGTMTWIPFFRISFFNIDVEEEEEEEVVVVVKGGLRNVVEQPLTVTADSTVAEVASLMVESHLHHLWYDRMCAHLSIFVVVKFSTPELCWYTYAWMYVCMHALIVCPIVAVV
jgi:hypothetical protein